MVTDLLHFCTAFLHLAIQVILYDRVCGKVHFGSLVESVLSFPQLGLPLTQQLVLFLEGIRYQEI